MAPQINTMREALDAETKAHQVTKDELELTKQRLSNATEAKTYAVIKASEQTAEMAKEITQLKEEHERQLKELREKHASERKATADENVRLLARVQDLEKDNVEVEAVKEKLRRYNEQSEHNIKSLRQRLKVANTALQQATERKQAAESETATSPVAGEKRKADWDEYESSEEQDQAVPCHKKPKQTIVACTQCVTHNWEDCDGGASCQNCVLRRKGDCCKRVMCKYYKKNTCSNLFCTMAHEGDGYTTLVPFTRLQKSKEKTLSPLQQQAQKAAKAKQRAHKKKTEPESMYDGLFDDLAMKRKKGKEGDDGGLVS